MYHSRANSTLLIDNLIQKEDLSYNRKPRPNKSGDEYKKLKMRTKCLQQTAS